MPSWQVLQLWFDVEKRYNTTTENTAPTKKGCGLM